MKCVSCKLHLVDCSHAHILGMLSISQKCKARKKLCLQLIESLQPSSVLICFCFSKDSRLIRSNRLFFTLRKKLLSCSSFEMSRKTLSLLFLPAVILSAVLGPVSAQFVKISLCGSPSLSSCSKIVTI